jgi:hypothetical protein
MVALAVGALASPALAGNTRDVYIGDPGGTTSGSLTYTPTVPGGLTAVDVQVRNDGGQTLNHASLYGGYAADAAPENPLFPKPDGASLASGLTFVTWYGPSGVHCTIGPDGDGNADRSLDCDLGSLPGLTSKTVRVIVRVPATAGTFATWFGAYFAEGNQTGTNQDNFYASGSITSAAATCTAGSNRAANYFLPGATVALTSANCGGTGTQGSLASRNAVGGQGGFGSLTVTGSITDCPAGYTCFGDGVEADILDGGPVPGGLAWTVTWYGTRSLGGVVHFWDSYLAGDPDRGDDYTTIPFSKKFQCSAKRTTDCWVSVTSSKANATPLWFKATFVTETNGKGRGFV